MTAIAKTRKGTAQRYAELLAAVLPKPIETEAENERALEIVNHLMSKGEKKLTPEGRWLLRMLVRRGARARRRGWRAQRLETHIIRA